MSPAGSTRSVPGGHIALVGLSGTGKSSVAPLVAAATGRRFVDLDREVEARAGRTVAEVFATEGEAGFRRRELAALTEALDGTPAVIATGGGVLTTPTARDLLAGGSCVVVWLRAEVDTLATRLAATDEVRPLLGDDPTTVLRELAARREALYRDAASAEVRVDDLTPGEVCAAILAVTAADPSTP